MAKRPSVKEILEAAKRGGAAVPGGEPSPAQAAAPTPEPAAEAPPPAAAAKAVAPASPSLGRPLTLKEKLAAARAGGTAPAPTPAAAQAAVASTPAPAAEGGVKAVPPPAPSLGRPMSLKEKLAAARSGGGSAPASAPAAGATPAKPAAAKPAASAVAAKRELPPLDKITDPKDLAEALRQTGAKKTQETADAVKAKAPVKAPAKEKESRPTTVLPKPTKAQALATAARGGVQFTRATLFSALGVVIIGWLFFAGAVTGFTVMLGRFMFPNVLAEPPSTIKVGLPSNYEPEAVNERFKAEWGFWIVRSTRFNGQDVIYALSTICTHLGCPPNWLNGEQKFKCPCHGSGFYISGVNFEGPAPRPLERFKVSVGDDGQMVVDKSQKFQQELGQWADPDSYLNA